MQDDSKETPEHAPVARETFPTALPPLDPFREGMERLFRAFAMPEMNWRSGNVQNAGTLGFRIDVSETETEIQVVADLPGVDKQSIDVTLEQGLLRIRAEKSSDTSASDRTWHIVERSYGALSRAIRVPDGVDPEAVNATFKDGLLTISLRKPKELATKARKIAVSVG
ncbi:MAG: Hsp20/alpha crystallin family protein [Pseudomonadota bacterium]